MDDKIASAGHGDDGAHPGGGAAPLDLGAADAGAVEELIAKTVGKRLTRPLRDELRRLGEVVRARGETCDVVGAATERPWKTPSGAVYDLDLDLLDAALDAGVPIGDPGAGTVFALRAWLARARRGQLTAVAADARFRPLLRDAVLDWRGDLLALGRPGSLLSHDEGAAEAVLAAAGIVDVLGEAVAAWAEQVRGGSLPALHEAVCYLDLLGPAPPRRRVRRPGPARRHRRHPGRRSGRGARRDLAHRARRRTRRRRGRRVRPIQSHRRRLPHRPRRRRRGRHLRGRGREPQHHLRSARRRRRSALQALPPPAQFRRDHRPVPVRRLHLHRRAARPRRHPRHRRHPARRPRPGPRPPHRRRVLGTPRRARHRHRPLVPGPVPPQRRLRHPQRRTATPPLGIRQRTRPAPAGLAPPARPRHRRLPAAPHRRPRPGRPRARRRLRPRRRHRPPRHRTGQAPPRRRPLLGSRRSLRRPPRGRGARTPGITADRFLDGIAGTLWTALEVRGLAARHLDDASTLRTTPLPYPHADAGDLRARIFTGMQDMYRRIQTVADLCADPDVPAPPQHVDLANAQGWEQKLGRLGGQALRAALSTAGTSRGGELNNDGLRSCGVLPMSDPAGRWRTMTLTLDVRNGPREGTVCRTPRGCLIVLQRSNSGPVTVLEYAADGVFGAPPFGSTTDARICAGWGGADRIAALLRLLDERGAAPWPEKSVAAFAEATHMPVARAAILTVGFEPRNAYMVRRGNPGMTQPFADAAGLSARDLADAGAGLARDVPIELRLELPEYLMPDDPEDLWRDRLAVTRAAAWWNAAVLDGPTTPG
ncbi:hypothetical protein ACU686_08795 [Yinghuangia aomiensis]